MPFVSWNFTFDPISDETRAIEAFSATYGYSDTIFDEEGDPIPNPQTALDFSLERISMYIQELVQAYEFEELRMAVIQPVVVEIARSTVGGT